MSEKIDKRETIESRAKTDISRSSVSPEGKTTSEAPTVPEVSEEIAAQARKPPPNWENKPSITGPMKLPDEYQLAVSGGRCIVPRIASDQIETLRRQSLTAKYMSDYIELLIRMGAPHFELAHQYPFLVGVGVMGEVYDAPRSTRDHSTREVFIENVGIVASQTPILATRVWPLIDTKNAMTTPGISLGRASINDVVITEYALSKGHCRFNLDETKTAYVLRDLNSTNGTYLNGEKLAPNMAAPVKHLDIIILGRYQFQYFTSGGFLRELIDRAQTSS